MVNDGPGYTEHEHDGLPRYRPKAAPGEWDVSRRAAALWTVFVPLALVGLLFLLMYAVLPWLSF